ncbi:dephospho-CoA kinase [Aliidiomarina sanyensis]|uniref:Dephospho-CoA kinase n=1 Tax=Aliidiomarina sanyensis TaxID=1249555 RepID=A0A432WI49_9GAMM|nr:dephospho-CoA kinase [Aliidiomarina sanyensis]RUO33496.1 dephospho-CoA kinase [Aliidiomarina sanyensis]
MKQPYIVGVTGGIGAGKTTVTNQFLRLGIEVVDADLIARSVVAPGSPLLKDIQAEFGNSMIKSNGELDRAALRALIFSDENAKTKLNALMHPVIRDQLLAALERAKSSYVILSAPLLFENKLDTLCQRVLVVDVPESEQIARTQARDGVDANQVAAIIAAQISRTERLARADDVIDNTLPITQLAETVSQLHEKYLHFAKSQ